jgi:arginyl-tRNA synthetase
LKKELEALLRQTLSVLYPELSPVPDNFLERPRQADHGDFASNIAMQLAKRVGEPPRQIAEKICLALPQGDLIESTEIAGPGFINFRLKGRARFAIVSEILSNPRPYGAGEPEKQGYLQIEFVSSNPTGPLHVGHGRGAAFGASLANLLEFAGWRVDREYYVNDAGRQMDILTVSTWLRALSFMGVDLPFPPNGYQGDYVTQMAENLPEATRVGLFFDADTVLTHCPRLPDPSESLDDQTREVRIESHMDALIARAKVLLGERWFTLHSFVLREQLADCRQDLEEFGVVFDQWFSEQSLYDSGRVAQVVKSLDERGHLYRKAGALWFASTQFGDEKDRVVQRENGLYTYFASDIAYHDEKFSRGYTRIVNVWGADHHGYIPRVKAALTALGHDASKLDVPLVQFVSLFREGEKVQMSTRKGQFVTLRELRGETGRDAARFFYVLRKSDQHLDFDLSLATRQSSDNPVYYVQYAHARVHSLLRKWGHDPARLLDADLSRLGSEYETVLTQKLAEFPELIQNAALDYAPHSIAFYLKDLAAHFHSYYNAEVFVVKDNEALTEARLALALATARVIRSGLSLLGVNAPEQM